MPIDTPRTATEQAKQLPTRAEVDATFDALISRFPGVAMLLIMSCNGQAGGVANIGEDDAKKLAQEFCFGDDS